MAENERVSPDLQGFGSGVFRWKSSCKQCGGMKGFVCQQFTISVKVFHFIGICVHLPSAVLVLAVGLVDRLGVQ